MRLSFHPLSLSLSLSLSLGLGSLGSATILDNGHRRETNFINTLISPGDDTAFATYSANAAELSYKGRWDSKHVSWWTAPGLKFGFTGKTVAIKFGQLTIDTTLVGWRIGGMDWNFSNVTAGGTHLFVTESSAGIDAADPFNPTTFEMRVTNWGYGVQIDKVHLAEGEKLAKVENFARTIEFVGDSLMSGYSNSYEAMSGFAYGVGAGLGNTEFSITAIPGICVTDQECWGNPRGQSHQWFYTSDTTGRAANDWGDEPEPWHFDSQPAADIVIINIGTNDQNEYNKVLKTDYIEHYKKLIRGIHGKWPQAQIVVMSLWLGFYQKGNSYFKTFDMDDQIKEVASYFNSAEYLEAPVYWDGVTNTTTTTTTTAVTNTTAAEPDPSSSSSSAFVHIFNTTGILQHNDIGPTYHPTDTGQIKITFSLIQYIRMKFGWELELSGPELFHETLYWNDQVNY